MRNDELIQLTLASCVALGTPSLTAPSAIEVRSLSPGTQCCPIDGSPTDQLEGLAQMMRAISASTGPEPAIVPGTAELNLETFAPTVSVSSAA